MILYAQIAAAWRNKELGWGPPGSTIGKYGCYDTTFAMIAHGVLGIYDPASLDDLFTAQRIFMPSGGGDFDLLPDNALDRAVGGRFTTETVGGWDQARVNAAVASNDTWCALFLVGYSPLWKMNITHFVLAFGGTRIADSYDGVVRDLSAHGGVGNVKKMMFVHVHPDPATAAAAIAAAQAAAQAAQAAKAAQAASDAAAAEAKAKADAASAQAALDAANLAASLAAIAHQAQVAQAAAAAAHAEAVGQATREAEARSQALPLPSIPGVQGCNIIGRQIGSLKP